jgi:hypothetical protein
MGNQQAMRDVLKALSDASKAWSLSFFNSVSRFPARRYFWIIV